MLRLALLFFIVSLIAGLLGFTGIAVATAGVAKFLFFLFLILFLFTLALAYTAINPFLRKRRK